MLFTVLLAFLGMAMATPTGIVSNIYQGQTQVSPAQPIMIGGGGPKAHPYNIIPNTCTAGSPFNVTVVASNPNNYTVIGTVYVNITASNLSPSKISINPQTLTYWLYVSYSVPMNNTVLIHVYPQNPSQEWSIPANVTNFLVIQFLMTLDVSGSYTYTVWMAI